MDNIFSYLKWRGDLNFLVSSFNNIDNLIFCALSYLDFDLILKNNEIITIKELYRKYENAQSSSIFHKNSEKMFKILSESKRFMNIKIAKYKRVNDSSLEKQFGAMTFIIPDDTLYVAFCGTDESLVGWKEDFNLSYMPVIPAQTEALKYLEDIMANSLKNVIIGGHSKGGNLAMYSAIFCNSKYKNRIIKVYNNDGPGLPEDINSDLNFLEVKEKILTFLPKSSIVGGLFYNNSLIKIIDSYGLGILQHDLFSWKVSKSDLVYLEGLGAKESELIKKFNQKLESIPKNKRKKIINFIYDLLINFNIDSVDDLLPNMTEITKNLSKYNLDIDNLELIKELVEIVIQIFHLL